MNLYQRSFSISANENMKTVLKKYIDLLIKKGQYCILQGTIAWQGFGTMHSRGER
jgi:hypothetical protein